MDALVKLGRPPPLWPGWARLPVYDRQHIRLDVRPQSHWQDSNEDHFSLTLQPSPSPTVQRWADVWLAAIYIGSYWPVCQTGWCSWQLQDICITWGGPGDTSVVITAHCAVYNCAWWSRATETSVWDRTVVSLSWGQWTWWSQAGEEGLHQGSISTAGIAEDAWGDAATAQQLSAVSIFIGQHF